MLDVENLKVKQNTFENLPKRLRYNSVISHYYENYYEEEKNEFVDNRTLLNKAERLTDCAQVWSSNYYRWANQKEIISSNLCKDRFCLNCQSSLAYQRYLKFYPLLSNCLIDNSIYHCVFTVKNCSGILLKSTIKTMFKSFYNFNEYLNGHKKIKSYDFTCLGYKGAIRSLEVTFNEKDNDYHPHLHCLLVFNKNLRLEKHNVNAFSFNKNKPDDVVSFSDEEVLFQKIWFLLNTGQKVNRQNIESLELGYSVKFDRASENSFKEVFKYAFKADLDKNECMGYEVFKTYLGALPGLRFISGYGRFQGIKFEDDEDIETQSTKELISFYFESLREQEEPVVVHEHYSEVIKNIENNQIYLTRNTMQDSILGVDTENRLTEESKKILEDFTKSFEK